MDSGTVNVGANAPSNAAGKLLRPTMRCGTTSRSENTQSNDTSHSGGSPVAHNGVEMMGRRRIALHKTVLDGVRRASHGGRLQSPNAFATYKREIRRRSTPLTRTKTFYNQYSTDPEAQSSRDPIIAVARFKLRRPQGPNKHVV